MLDLVNYFVRRWDLILDMTIQHLSVVLMALSISIVIGVTIGFIITLNKTLATITLSLVSMIMTVPSLALFSVMVPIFGVGSVPAIIGLVGYTQLPIIRNVYAGLMNIDPAVVDSARGMGLSTGKIMYKIKIPLAMPVIFAGIRTAVVLGMGIAAIAAYIGAGGLGVMIFQGINRANINMVMAGAIVISVLTIVVDRVLFYIQKRFELGGSAQ